MHLYLAIRGHKERVDRFINDCLAQYYPYKNKDKDGKWIKGQVVQLAPRPVTFWEFVFPEDQLMNVLATLRPNDNKGFERTTISNRIGGMVRKILKLDPMPSDEEIKKHKPLYPMPRGDIDIVAIGTKKDEYKDEVECL